jgi:hypothetical protein
LSSGEVYSGNFNYNLKQGKGRWDDGKEIYDGQFNNDIRHGEG